jgi:hypothetical protein
MLLWTLYGSLLLQLKHRSSGLILLQCGRFFEDVGCCGRKIGKSYSCVPELDSSQSSLVC